MQQRSVSPPPAVFYVVSCSPCFLLDLKCVVQEPLGFMQWLLTLIDVQIEEQLVGSQTVEEEHLIASPLFDDWQAHQLLCECVEIICIQSVGKPPKVFRATAKRPLPLYHGTPALESSVSLHSNIDVGMWSGFQKYIIDNDAKESSLSVSKDIKQIPRSPKLNYMLAWAWSKLQQNLLTSGFPLLTCKKDFVGSYLLYPLDHPLLPDSSN